MKDIIHYQQCPICASNDLHDLFRVKDETVSKQEFLIVECKSCTLRFTQDVPGPNAIAPYYQSDNYISHTDTKKGLVNRLYHVIRKKALVRKRKLVEEFSGLRQGAILDIGSGTGAFMNEMSTNGWQITGLEPDPGAKKIAKEQYKIELKELDTLYKLQPESFDAITLWHVLEHVHDLTAYMQQLRKLLKPTGCILIAVPNYTSLDASIYKEHWAAYDVPRHLYHFSPQSMKILVENNALRIITYKPLWYDSFYISLLSSKYKNGKSNWIGAVWNGLRSNLATLKDVKRCSSVIYVIAK